MDTTEATGDETPRNVSSTESGPDQDSNTQPTEHQPSDNDEPARDRPAARLQEARKQARIAEDRLDGNNDAAQYARIAGTVIEWALDELDEEGDL